MKVRKKLKVTTIPRLIDKYSPQKNENHSVTTPPTISCLSCWHTLTLAVQNSPCMGKDRVL